MVNFNATQVGLERTAAFYCDLPLGIDERQLAGKNQEGLEKTIYMIASGTGKIRGAKGGGLQTMRQWRTVAMATGEEPLSTDVADLAPVLSWKSTGKDSTKNRQPSAQE